MRINNCALPPVKAKPKPSIVWKCWASSTVSTGCGPASEEKRNEVACSATTAVRSGVVSHSRASGCCWAFEDKEENSREQDENRINLSFMRPPIDSGSRPFRKDKRLQCRRES